MDNQNTIPQIPKEKFEFVHEGDIKIADEKFKTKPVGYFMDAWRRFRKNKASIVATIIIIFIVLFAIFVPIFSSERTATLMDVYYAKKGPYSPTLAQYGIMDGSVSTESNVRQYANYLAIGIGAEDTDGTFKMTLAEAEESEDLEYSPVIKLKGTYEQRETFYEYSYNSYLAVGFVELQVPQDEYSNIVAWQEETGIQVLYPLVARNNYNFGQNDYANYWYKCSPNGNPMRTNSSGNVINIDMTKDFSQITLEDNYERDENGNVKYSKYVGGGDENTAELRIRVLYYNYYQYANGEAPFYLLGTDSQGYDMAYRLANGIRLSLFVAICVSVINLVLGAIYGAIEGYYGGIVDLTLERVSDILSGVPFIIVATLFQMHLAQKVGVIPSLLFAYVVTGWIGTASRVRTQFYRFKNQEYVMAARTLGARDRRIIWKHIFPNALGTIITSSVLVIPGVIGTESMLSFLGIVNLGGSDSTSLGTLISGASKIWTTYPHLMLYPALVLSLLMICFNLFGNGLRDAFNPSLRGSEE